jgi:hypothetical protein
MLHHTPVSIFYELPQLPSVVTILLTLLLWFVAALPLKLFLNFQAIYASY